MNNLIFKEVVEDSPLAYFLLKCIKNDNNEYIDAILIDGNKSFSHLINSDLNDIKNCYLSNLMDEKSFKQINFSKFFKSTIKTKKSISISYCPNLDKYLNSELYYSGDDIFLIRCSEVLNNQINFAKILQNSPFSFWIKDRNGKYLEVNKKFEERCGKPYSEIIGHSDYDIWPDKYAKKYKKQDINVMKDKKIYHFQETIIGLHELNKKSSSVYDITKWPCFDTNDNVIGSIGMAIEMINDVKLRESLVKNEENFTDIAKYSEDVFILADNEKALYVSPSFYKVFGQNPKKLYKDANDWFDYYHPDDITKEDLSINFEDTFEFVKRVNPTNSKGDKWVWVKSSPIKDERGNMIKRIVIICDVTKKRKMNLELESLRMDFFANISHELRTPLNVIFSALQLLKLKSCSLDDEELEYVCRYLGIIEQNGYRLLKLVNNLIDCTKIDAGYLEYKPQNFDIINFVENICMSVCEFINQNGMNLIFDTDTEEKIIAFDLDMMERIILNLLSNAIKFNSKNGKVEVNISCDEYINISIKDSGIGIAEDKIGSIFGRFEQLSSKKLHNKEGSGIGLSLVKSLVDIHGGKIAASSKINEGTTFTVSIPSILVEKKSNTPTYNALNDCSKVNRMNVEFSDIYF
ncbi:sensor histidine kinase [Romboutsia lituseburensis]|uniref:sensor histidine kinase n=1 Tax=Romboutsia lituseburensis TaxID=1537 RepID=UPI00215A8A2F|nr:PAS domain-containing sensor histidine kinase [Romboutsia lituseburensis]MCR8747065.1 ATP-binding protein [Romboutsia lituseburensis]